ncbi:hypothetical protein [Georgfuchsia toluolica]|uniref:hypothetical protein n=1 Tax=Georgfuchsia toluolica TaxID=424218 RepID=UPI001C72AC6D|nr:hypothetical protein [Georgfuchsia toluolica]
MAKSLKITLLGAKQKAPQLPQLQNDIGDRLLNFTACPRLIWPKVYQPVARIRLSAADIS